MIWVSAAIMPSLRHNLEVPPKYIEIEKTRQIQEIKRRMQSYLARNSMIGIKIEQ
jgi:predicted phosphoribosyltransferase